MTSDLFLLGAAVVDPGLEEVYEFGLLGDGPLHLHLLMGVHSLQVELSEHHYRHEFLLMNFTSHREDDRDREIEREGAREEKTVQIVGVLQVCVCVGG